MTGAVISGARRRTSVTLSNTSAPVVTGSNIQGQTLTTTVGGWSVTPDSYTYVWNRSGTPISGATASTYVLQAADIGTTITSTVTAIKAGYPSASGTSAATRTIAGAVVPITETFSIADQTGWPSGWSDKGGAGTFTTNVVSNAGRIVTSGASGRIAKHWDAMSPAIDMDVTVSVTPITAGAGGQIAIQADDLVVSGGYSPQNGYTIDFGVKTSTTGEIYFNKRLNGVGSNINQTFNNALIVGTKYKFRIQRTGTTVRFKFWDASGAEPGTWKATTTADASLPAGKVRVAGAGNGTTVDYDDITVA
jgi:hypothetical protein